MSFVDSSSWTWRRIETSLAYGKNSPGTDKNLGQVHSSFFPQRKYYTDSRDFSHDWPSIMHFSPHTDPTDCPPSLVHSSRISFVIFLVILFLLCWISCFQYPIPSLLVSFFGFYFFAAIQCSRPVAS